MSTELNNSMDNIFQFNIHQNAEFERVKIKIVID